MTQPIIRFEGVSKAFGTQTVLRDFSLDVEPGAFVSIIGRSGCGKTTVLKLVNGLLSPDTGRVLIQGQDVARIDPVALRRRIGYAIQNVGLFPHMTVEKNIAYVPAISGLEEWKGKQCREKVAALLKQVGLDPALSRTLTSRLMDPYNDAGEPKPAVECIDIPQGILHMSPPTKELERLIYSHRMRHVHNTCARWCFGNARCYVDANEFQSTPPGWGGDRAHQPVLDHLLISIHAPV